MKEKEQLKVAASMVAYGGSFIIALGQTLFKADPENAEKIKQAWPECWEKYLTWEEEE